MPDIVAEHGIKQQFERGKKDINSLNAIRCSVPQKNGHAGVVVRRYAAI
jgi:hypothetical protein